MKETLYTHTQRDDPIEFRISCIMYAIQSYKTNTTHSLSVTNQMENDLYKSKKGHVSSTWLLAPTLYIPSRITSSTI